MSDMDEEDDLSKFAADEEDRIKPIDVGGSSDAAEKTENQEPGSNPVPEDLGAPLDEKENADPFAGSNPVPEDLGAPIEGDKPDTSENKPEEPFLKDEEPEPFLKDDPLDDPNADKPPLQDSALSEEVVLSQEERAEDEARMKQIRQEMAMTEAQKGDYDDSVNFINKGEYVDLLEKAPTLKSIMIGAGWDNKSFEEDMIDVDISLFMLDKTDMTREDGDFIFYNQDRAFDGAVYHMGDSRSGAGDGDDENIFIDLNGLPFDILKIIFVLSIYDPEIQGHHFGMVRNMYVRIQNKDDGAELFRYKLDPEDHKGGNAIIIGTLIREGPRWIYEADAQVQNGGLAKIATEYGIIIKELQSTGEDVEVPEDEVQGEL